MSDNLAETPAVPPDNESKRPFLENVIRYLAFGFSFLFFFFLIGIIGFFCAFGLSFGKESDAAYAPRVLFMLIAIVILFAVSAFLFKSTIRYYPDEMQKAGGGKFDSALKYLFLGFVIDLLIFVTVGMTGSEYVLTPDCIVMLLIPPVAGAVCGFFKPLKYPSGRAIPALILAVISGFFFLFAARITYDLLPREIHYRTQTVQPDQYPALPAKMICSMLPPQGKNVEITGTSGFGFGIFWKCTVDETDLTDWFRASGRQWAENDWMYNVNPETNGEKVHFGTLFRFPENKVPENVLNYVYRYTNNGGWYLAYDREAHILYGHYSSF